MSVLNKEYHSNFKLLSKENKRTVRRMQHYLETKYINEIVFENMMNDLLGMALESQARGESLQNTIGMDYKTFCQELADNAKKQTPAERVLYVSQWLILFGGIIVPLLYVFYAVFGFSKPSITGVYLTAPTKQLFMYLSVATTIIIGWFIVKRFTYSAQTIVFGLYLIAITGTFLLTDFLGTLLFDDTIKINILIWIASFAAALAFVALLRRNIAIILAKIKK